MQGCIESGTVTKEHGMVTCDVPTLAPTLADHSKPPQNKPKSECAWVMMLGDSQSRMAFQQFRHLVEGLLGGQHISEWPTLSDIFNELERDSNLNGSCSNPKWWDREQLYMLSGRCIRFSFRFMHSLTEPIRVQPWSRAPKVCGNAKDWYIGANCRWARAAHRQMLPGWALMPAQPDLLWVSHGMWETPGKDATHLEPACKTRFDSTIAAIQDAKRANISVFWQSNPTTFAMLRSRQFEEAENACQREQARAHQINFFDLFEWTSADRERVQASNFHYTNFSACIVSTAVFSQLLWSDKWPMSTIPSLSSTKVTCDPDVKRHVTLDLPATELFDATTRLGYDSARDLAHGLIGHACCSTRLDTSKAPPPAQSSSTAPLLPAQSRSTAKCCWNRRVQKCSRDSDCDPGGEGCTVSGTITKQHGKNVCENAPPAAATVAAGPGNSAKCCWNRVVQPCSSDGDCDRGGEGCIANGSMTKRHGQSFCKILELIPRLVLHWRATRNSSIPAPEWEACYRFDMKGGAHRESDDCTERLKHEECPSDVLTEEPLFTAAWLDQSTKNGLRPFCTSLDKPGISSMLHCSALQGPIGARTTNSFFEDKVVPICVATNVSLDLDLIAQKSMANMDEYSKAVVTGSLRLGEAQIQPGALTFRCSPTTNFSPQVLAPYLDEKYAETTAFGTTQWLKGLPESKDTLASSELRCDHWVHEPIFLLRRRDCRNTYHSFEDFLAVCKLHAIP